MVESISKTNAWLATAPIRDLVSFCTNQQDEPAGSNQLVYLEIVDRIRDNPESCREVARHILNVLKIDHSKSFS
jgi:hypothetical protein